MNRKAVSVLIPLFTITIIILLAFTILKINDLQRDEAFQVPIGDRQESAISLYHQSHAIHLYAYQSGRIAIQHAINTQPIQFLEGVEQEFMRVMTRHPDQAIVSAYDISRSQNTIQINSQRDITIASASTSRMSPRPTTVGRGAGIFDTWPVQHDENNPAYMTSLFGFRDTTSSRMSKAHPAIDIRAPQGAAVFSLEAGEVLQVVGDYALIQHANGWTCAYFHINPQVRPADTVTKQQQIGTINFPNAPHLDLRCYSHEYPLSEEDARQLFPGGVVSTTENQRENTHLYAIYNSMGVWIDPFCLFTANFQEEMVRSQEERRSSGLKWKTAYTDARSVPEEEISEIMYTTCDAYANEGILGSQTSFSGDALSQSFIDALIDHTITDLETDEFTNNPRDRGGPTKYGITQATLSNFRGRAVSAQEVEDLTEREARDIYAQRYYFDPRINLLPIDIIPIVFDAGVNQGQGTAAQYLSEVLSSLGYSVPSQTRITQELADATQTAIVDLGSETVQNAYVDRRIQGYLQIIANDPSQDVFRCGWLRRAESFRPENSADDVFRAPGCRDERYYAVIGGSQVAGNAWSGIASSMAHARSEIVYSFPLRVSVELTQGQRIELDGINSLHDALRRCPANDENCLRQSTQNVPSQIQGFNYCPEYASEFAHAIANCREHFVQGARCACPVPMPSSSELQSVRWDASELVLTSNAGDATTSAYWLSAGDEGGQDIEFIIAMDTAETAHATQASSYITWSASSPRTLAPELSASLPQFDPLNPLNPLTSVPQTPQFERVMWITSNPASIVAISSTNTLVISPHSTLPACHTTVERTYCRQKPDGAEQSFEVLVQTRPTAPPSPPVAGPGGGISFPNLFP